MPSSRESSWPRVWTTISWGSCIVRQILCRFFTTEPPGKPEELVNVFNTHEQMVSHSLFLWPTHSVNHFSLRDQEAHYVVRETFEKLDSLLNNVHLRCLYCKQKNIWLNQAQTRKEIYWLTIENSTGGFASDKLLLKSSVSLFLSLFFFFCFFFFFFFWLRSLFVAAHWLSLAVTPRIFLLQITGSRACGLSNCSVRA